LTALFALNRAVLPVEQLLFTLVMGIPVIPRPYRALYTISNVKLN
jgi:hypothetical protein